MRATQDAFRFEVLHRAPGGARRGRITTAHGTVETPAFMPVATVGSVKGVTPADLEAVGVEMVLANAYHLYLRPGVEIVRELGGLARFMGWNRPTLTDSGGFQVFSLGELVQLSDEGVRIRSHLDGSMHEWTAEKVVAVQEGLGVDVMMPLDDCPAYPAERKRLQESVERTARWLGRTRLAWKQQNALFGIVQGGTDLALRTQSASSATALELSGYAVGGLSVGEPKDLLYATAEATAGLLPLDRPRYLMGAGTPEDLLHLVALGYDLFDCVLPTRNGRNGTLFTANGRLNIRNAAFARDPRPLDPTCECPVCRRFSRAYLRHLALSGEILSATLNSLHNVAFYQRLVREMRQALEQDRFPEYTSRALGKLSGADEAQRD